MDSRPVSGYFLFRSMIAHLSRRDARHSLFLGLLFLGVLLSTLGAPISCWDLDALGEDCVSAAFIVHATAPDLLPPPSYLLTPGKTMASYAFLHDQRPFHPPIFATEQRV
jgi:hypothetical protein